MIQYPKNRIYAIIPIEIFKKYLGKYFDVARKSLDGKSVIWKFKKNDEILKKIKQEKEIKFYSHNNALQKMKLETWSKPEKISDKIISKKLNFYEKETNPKRFRACL